MNTHPRSVFHSVKRLVLASAIVAASPVTWADSLVPANWNAKQAGDEVMARLVKVTGPEVKGAHDAEFVIHNGKAFIVTEVNDERAGESAEWPQIYISMSVVDLQTLKLEKFFSVARSEQAFENETLPVGACFVPRIIVKDAKTLRCFFASEQPKVRQAQTWYFDFDPQQMASPTRIHKMKIKTAAGVFDMQPQYYYADAVAHGFQRPATDFGLYLFDAFKKIDGKNYLALNNYGCGQNGLAVINEALDTVEVLGHYNEPGNLRLTESAFNRLPDGTWMAICRQDGGTQNYAFTTSKDGKTWSTGEYREQIPNGAGSKPTFEKLKGVYYLGWQEKTRINNVSRSVFNIDVSRDGIGWERKYRFETEKSFQYPAFHEADGTIWLTVTQGDTDPSRKERIMFGKLE